MSIEFVCPSCQRTLTVPDDAVGKSARCPNCQNVAAVSLDGPKPAVGTHLGQAGQDDRFGAPPPSPDQNPFGPTAPNPFAGDQPTGFGDYSNKQHEANPYSSPGVARAPLLAGGKVAPRAVEAGDIFRYGWQVWSENLGLLVGSTVIVAVISAGFSGASGALEAVATEAGEPIFALMSILIDFASLFFSVFVGIGQTQIALALARRQPAEIGMLFSGGPRYLPALGITILLGLGIVCGGMLLVVPGIIVAIFYWPSYFLVIDNKSPVLDSFGVAREITSGNEGTTILVWMIGVAATVVGFLMLCVGLLFTVPLTSVLWAVSYLAMSGQISLATRKY